ncbi:MAG: TonB-dependent receptor [Chromatiaceae bacterium]|nr:TonB-dependent receptor [Chromatiaceae bacterium]
MKSIILGLAFSAIGCAAFTTEAATSDISWNYVGAGYAKANIKNIAGNDIDLNGYQLNGSYLLSDNVYLHASYYDVSGDLPLLDDIMGLEFEASEWQFGLGYRHAVYDNIDSFFQAGYVRSELGVVGFENDTLNGFQAVAGFRYKVLPELELSAALRYNDSSDSDSSTYGDIGARYSVTTMFDLYLNYQFDSDVSLLGAGVAVKF